MTHLSFTFITARACTAMLLCLLTGVVSASDHYQFLASTAYSDIDVASGNGKRYSLSVKAYWNPVKLDGSSPYASANFYQRVSRISASVSEQQLSDLNQVLGGRVLKQADSDVKAAHLRLATKDLPVWAEFSYMRFNGSDDFSDGLTSDYDRATAKRYGLGYFITDDTALSVSYLDADPQGLGVELSHLFRFQSEMFLELAVAYQELKYKRTQLVVVNNTIRNAFAVTKDSDLLAARLSYSPMPALQLSLAYSKQNVSQSSQANRRLDVSWWFAGHFAVSAYYQDYQYGGDIRSGLGGANYFIDVQKGLSLSMYF